MAVAGTGLDKNDLKKIQELLQPLDDRLNLLEQDFSNHKFQTQQQLKQIQQVVERMEATLTKS
jgi:ferritin-like metal-binding protein YciE